jgi:ribosomal protein L21E
LVFACKAWPYSGHCGQAGYEPNVNPATPEAWRDAWTIKGYCNGSIGPTSSPNYDPAKSIGACPEVWSSGIHTKYEEGDMVSVTVSTVPLRKVAFKCKAWPYSGHCAQFAPDAFGGDQGWTIAGSCDGSIGPTQSPSFNSLAKITGCPREYSSSTSDYEAGDLVAVTVSVSPLRQIVYQCKNWPESGYCNQSGDMAPGKYYGNLGWILKGSCDGSNAPTGSPVQYTGNLAAPFMCQYQSCSDVVSACTCSDSTCPSTSGQTTGCKRTTNVCVMNNVNVYSTSASYKEGDEVRVNVQRYKCRGWPNSGWCGNEGYQPEVTAVSADAWTKSGICS